MSITEHQKLTQNAKCNKQRQQIKKSKREGAGGLSVLLTINNQR